ncbi:copper radical oxidase [Macrolepiota fuliginosa MF-IS2]|uniref:Copper radical oxidase n=1 Tax=Macrolepiota fuliginosa MF-IS2 TaxID=1400762 RepID=A0A9P6C433_9AGAR|nr:copper radical oxidase [Macrolepiota fuliginosa MF-IS2]
MGPLRSFLLPLSFLIGRIYARENAVLQHVRRARFRPHYEASICRGYDSASPLIQYQGKWHTTYSLDSISGSIQTTKDRGAAFSFPFIGTGIEWFGNCNRTHGYAQVFLDDQLQDIVDLACDADITQSQQIQYSRFDLEDGPHMLKVVNLGSAAFRSQRQRMGVMDVDALVVVFGHHTSDPPFTGLRLNGPGRPNHTPRADDPQEGPSWRLKLKGTTGVAAMQLVVVSPDLALIIDKAEHNELMVNGHPAWAALYNLKTHTVKALSVQSNSFCAGGSFLSNGTLISAGGNPVVGFPGPDGFGDLDGLQALRLFHPCTSDVEDGCELYENHERIRMGSRRWYTTALRLQDGSIMIIGGSTRGDYINNSDMNNPTIEYYPPKAIHGSQGLPVYMRFLEDTLNGNLFPIAILLPDGKVFIAANNDAMIYDWGKNIERRLPPIPNDVRITYPMSGTALLLPLSPENDYTPEVLICGGTTVSDRKPPAEISSKDIASAQCSRMVLTESGIAQGWKVEQMPEPRLMPDAVILPTGQIIIINGARSGVAGYGNVPDRVGESNADNPILTPVSYDPQAPSGRRFYRDKSMPTSSIPRMYHSVATLTPQGSVMIAGSNPNPDRTATKYETEYRVEWLEPPYMQMGRPVIESSAGVVDFDKEFTIKLGRGVRFGQEVKVALMDFGFATHCVHANERLVWLRTGVSFGDASTLRVTTPPHGRIYPPGPGWLFVLVDGVPSEGVKIMIGGGRGPPVDQEAIDYVIENTSAG